MVATVHNSELSLIQDHEWLKLWSIVKDNLGGEQVHACITMICVWGGGVGVDGLQHCTYEGMDDVTNTSINVH
jgi:hypothetical protein